METKLIQYLAIKVITIAVGGLLSFSVWAHSVVLEGFVRIEDKIPVKGGSVVITELRPKLAQMPDAQVLKIIVTDRDGYFRTKLENVNGQLDVSLIRDHCEWKTAFITFNREDVMASTTLKADLSPQPDDCESKAQCE